MFIIFLDAAMTVFSAYKTVNGIGKIGSAISVNSGGSYAFAGAGSYQGAMSVAVDGAMVTASASEVGIGVAFMAASGSGGMDQTTVSPYDLEATHSQTLSNRQMNKLIKNIKENGIQETIKYVEVDGTKYVVDGHHRLIAAKRLGLKEIPIEQVELPYLGYKTVEDLYWFD